MRARSRRSLFCVLAVLAITIAAGACSRKAAISDGEAVGTSIAPTSTSTSTTSTTAAPGATDTTADPNASATPPSDEPETDAFGHTEEQNAAFRSTYAAAFTAECQRIWATYAAGDGALSDPDFAEDLYYVDDCITELDDSWGEFADSVAEAQTSGTDDAQIAASDLADPLCSSGGINCWSYGD